MQWIWSYPVWTLVLVALVAAGLTYLLYRKSSQKFEVAPAWIVVMSLLRFVALSGIGLLLLNPLLKYVSNEKIDPVILILEDRSASISAGMSTSQLKVYEEKLNALQSTLASKYQVRRYSFGMDLMEGKDDSSKYDVKGTDIQTALNSLEKRNIGQHIGAVILASDGIYTHGSNPIYSSSFPMVPIYTIAMGDTTTYADVWIQRLRYNDVVYIGDELQVLVDVAAENYRQQPIQVSLKNSGGKILQQKSLTITDTEWSETIEFKILGEQPGIHRYFIDISPLGQEKSFKNNHQEFYIQVIDGRQKIVLLYDAPHPDVRFIKESLSELKNIELQVSSVEEYKWNSAEIDMLILHGLPSLKNRIVNASLDKIIKNTSSVWWIVSGQTDLNVLNQQQNLVTFQNVQRTPNDVTPVFSKNYQKFYVSDAADEWLQQVPPLMAPYGQYQLSSQVDVCWYQKVGNVNTTMPLFITSENAQGKKALLLGEGMWRWGMQEYYQFESQSRSKEWVERLVQYISMPSDHRPFRIKSGKTIYNESEWISVEAAVYNEAVQLVNKEDVKLLITNDKGSSQEILMDKTQNAYTYNLGKLPAGKYHIKGNTTLGDKKLISEYSFAVQELDIETSRLKADHGLLNTISLQHHAKMAHPSSMEILSDWIIENENIRPLFKEIYKTKSLIDFKILLGIILLCLSIEWFLRRFLGQY